MKKNLEVAIVQAEIQWHDPSANFQRFQSYIDQIDEVDLILLPEMWYSGFTMHAHRYASYASEALSLMVEWASKKKAYVIGSMIIEKDDNYYNRLFVVTEAGIQATYDKKHLFGYAGEDRIYQAGNKPLLITIEGWKLSANICYDLRFPVWSRNTSDYHVLFYVANWPDKRLSAWDTLLKARAIENQSYVLGANCYGQDVWGNNYSGHSAAIDSFGQIIHDRLDGPGIISVSLDSVHLKEARETFPFLKDRDPFTLS